MREEKKKICLDFVRSLQIWTWLRDSDEGLESIELEFERELGEDRVFTPAGVVEVGGLNPHPPEGGTRRRNY